MKKIEKIEKNEKMKKWKNEKIKLIYKIYKLVVYDNHTFTNYKNGNYFRQTFKYKNKSCII